MFDYFSRIWTSFASLWDTSDFMPRWYCGDWSTFHGTVHIVSDLAIWAAYMAIPLVLIYFVVKRREDIPFPRVFLLFGLFIMSCGTTHLEEAIIFWEPIYRISAVTKVITAVVSWLTVLVLIQVIPLALTLPGTAALNKELTQEIAERKRSEALAQEREQFSRSIMDSLTAHIAVLGPDGTILEVNEAWRKFSKSNEGDPASTGVGSNYLLCCGEGQTETGQEAADAIQAVLSGIADRATLEYPCHAPDQDRWFLMSVSPLNMSSGGVVVSHVDITARKRVEEELKEARAQAEAADRSKSEFLANLSHEIRTPMTAVLGFSDLLLAKASDPDQAELLELLKRNGEYLVELLDSILDLSKIEAGRLDLERCPCSPQRIIEDVVSLMGVRAREKEVGLTLEYMGPIPESIESDPTRFRQILVNLVGNAIKFTEQGEVRMQVHYLTTDEQCRLQVDVIDTGIGISPEQQEHLFKPFAQGDLTVARRFGGTGLGLAISQRLAEMLGGQIQVRSAAGEGSTFTVMIDCGSVSNPHIISTGVLSSGESYESSAAVAPAVTELACRILLAEDTRANQLLVGRILEMVGAEVVIVANGQEALDAIEAHPGAFDIILMDMQMPVLSGYEAIEQLRARGDQTPVVALTASAMKGDRERCLAAGCDDYISKPIDRLELLRVVARICGSG